MSTSELFWVHLHPGLKVVVREAASARARKRLEIPEMGRARIVAERRPRRARGGHGHG